MIIKCALNIIDLKTYREYLGFFLSVALYEPLCEKTSLRGFRPGPTQTGLYSHRRCLEVRHFRFRKKRYCTVHVAKTKALISFVVTAKLICAFVFAYAKSRFSHKEAHIESIQTAIRNIFLLGCLLKAIYRFPS